VAIACILDISAFDPICGPKDISAMVAAREPPWAVGNRRGEAVGAEWAPPYWSFHGLLYWSAAGVTVLAAQLP